MFDINLNSLVCFGGCVCIKLLKGVLYSARGLGNSIVKYYLLQIFSAMMLVLFRKR